VEVVDGRLLDYVESYYPISSQLRGTSGSARYRFEASMSAAPKRETVVSNPPHSAAVRAAKKSLTWENTCWYRMTPGCTRNFSVSGTSDVIRVRLWQ
jgi:hypothetical protein